MNNSIKEEVTLAFSVTKWLILATFAGLIVGTATFIFISLLNIGISEARNFIFPYYFLVPVGLLLSKYIVNKFAPSATGHGTEKVIEAIHKKNDKMDLKVVPVKLIATIITIALGGSAGKEGPSAQIGASITSFFSDLLGLKNEDRKKLLICGISAGFGAVFGTPITGAIFAVEVLFVGSIMYEALLPAFISSSVAVLTVNSLGMPREQFSVIHLGDSYVLLFLKTILASILFAIMSFIFIETLKKLESLNKNLKINIYLKTFLAGIVLILIGVFVDKNSMGLGVEVIRDAITGKSVNFLSSISKIITTSITLSFGGSGGVLTPAFYVGSTTGAIIDHILQNKNGLFAAIGFVSVLSGIANTPIAASIMAVELFGADIIPFSTLACIITFLLTGHRSIFPTQILSMKKSRSLSIDLGVELDKVSIKDNKDDTYEKCITKIKDICANKNIIKKENIINLKALSMPDIVREMAEKASEINTNLSPEKIYKSVIQREDIISTNSGKKLAFPHADIDEIDDFIIICGISKDGISWEENREKVNIVFLILKPKNKHKQYLKILSRLVVLSKKPKSIELLINSSDKKIIFNKLKKL